MDQFLQISGTFSVSTVLAMFMAGLVGGFSHCTGMCSPFSIGFATNNYQKIEPKNLNEWNRAKASLVMPYHLGRISTYAALGAFSAYVSSMVSHKDWFSYARILMIIFAGLFFLAAALNSGILNKFIKVPYSTKFFSNLSKKLFGKTDFLSVYLMGVTLGFIPCGLVYGAFMVAASTASPIQAAIMVSTFGFATIIPLFLTTYGAGFFIKKLKNRFRVIAPAIMCINSVLIFILVFKLY